VIFVYYPNKNAIKGLCTENVNVLHVFYVNKCDMGKVAISIGLMHLGFA